MKLVIKRFEELTTAELYAILKARSAVFVVEQNCVYQDIDDIDGDSLHIFYEQDGNVAAYLRVYAQPNEGDIIRFGRVLTVDRGNGLGRKLMEKSIQTVKENTNATKISVHAQVYAIGFYEKFGFKITSDEFLEDGIPHVAMELAL